MSRINEGEVLLAIHMAELGVPFERQFYYCPGRRFHADFAYPQPEYRLLIEVNGGQRAPVGGHSGMAGIQRDNERLRHATRNGYFVARFTPDEVKCGAAKEWIRTFLEGKT